MNELSDKQVEERRRALQALKAELERSLKTTREGTKPVELDEPIGRLTRMDAIQQQHMSAAGRRSLDLRLKQVLQALNLIENGEYGACRKCEDPIGVARLTARPESPYCLDCQEEIDRKYA